MGKYYLRSLRNIILLELQINFNIEMEFREMDFKWTTEWLESIRDRQNVKQNVRECGIFQIEWDSERKRMKDWERVSTLSVPKNLRSTTIVHFEVKPVEVDKNLFLVFLFRSRIIKQFSSLPFSGLKTLKSTSKLGLCGSISCHSASERWRGRRFESLPQNEQ